LPRVVAIGSAARQFTGGSAGIDVEAATVGEMIRDLEARFPGFGEHIERRMAIAIDGEIHQDAHGAALGPDSEVYLFPRIGGG
jgi:molybdopterin converting factor small subunit